MTYYVRNGNTYSQTSSNALDIHDLLPPGTYTIKFNSITGQFYFEIVEDFTLPKKQYGDLSRNVERIVNTFNDRGASTGVLLAGEKGSGKTLLGKAVSLNLLAQNVPTVIINTNHCGEGFNTFIQQMEQPAVIFFDEFEKIYDNEEQEQILTLLDGVYPTKKLFIITANDKWRIDQHMRNRPGRIFYALDFEGLSREFVDEYANENLVDKSQVGSVVNVASLFPKFNFDMLKAIVEEMNRYKENAQDAIRMLNTKPESSEGQKFDIKLYQDGVEVSEDKIDENEWRGNPLNGTVHIYLEPELSAKGKVYKEALNMGGLSSAMEKKYAKLLSIEGDEQNIVAFKNTDLVKMDGVAGTFTYLIEEEGVTYTLVLTKQKESLFNYSKLL